MAHIVRAYALALRELEYDLSLSAEDLGIDRDDVRRMVSIDLAPHLPMYEERANEYVHETVRDKFRPAVIFIQGVRMDAPSVLSEIASNGYKLHHSPNDSRFNYRNVTAIDSDLDIRERSEIRMIAETNGKQVELAPDCLVDAYYDNGRMVRLYNFESIRGTFFEVHRVKLANLIVKDAYIHKIKDPDYKNGLMYMAADLHADEANESVRILLGRMTREGVCPSGWTDVWAILHNKDHADGNTERQTSVFDGSIKIPSLVRPRRHTYFLAYGDVFGREGTPLTIDLNGNKTTDNGIPYSDDYGLTADIWIPPLNQFTTKDRKGAQTIE